jgi:hypothetical protein
MSDENLDFSFDDFESNVEESSAENTETIETKPEESTKEIKAESQAEPEAESESTEGDKKEAKGTEETEGKDSGAESPTEEYKPNFSYKIKDAEHEFPEYLRDVVKNEETEGLVRDLLTRADALESIKESRATIETEANDYRQNVENKIYPVLDTIAEFDQAVKLKDFSKAFELSDINPSEIVDHMLMDEKLADIVFEKALAQIKLEENGPQAVNDQRLNYAEQRKSGELELQNKQLSERLNSLESNSYAQALDFTIQQNAAASASYEAHNGAGSFKNFVNDYSTMQKNKGVNLSPADAVSGSLNMLGLSNVNAAPMGNNDNKQEHAKVLPQVTKRPDVLPNIGTGSNVSMVQKTANNWDDWEKGLNA